MPPALQLALLVAILLPAVKVAASVCERWRIPPILGELLVGVADIERMRKASGVAFLVALGGVIVPFVLGTGMARLFGLSWTTALFLGGALTATSVSISARTLMDAAKMSSAEASVILGAAVIDDVMGLFVLAFLASSTTSSQGEGFGVAAMASSWFKRNVPAASGHHWGLMLAILAVAVIGKLVGCGAAALACGMDWARSARVGC